LNRATIVRCVLLNIDLLLPMASGMHTDCRAYL
jgi:hypothetical protein